MAKIKLKKSNKRYIMVKNIPSKEADMILADILFQIGVHRTEWDMKREAVSIEEGWSYPNTQSSKVAFALYDENRLMMFEHRMAHDLPGVEYVVTDDPSDFEEKKGEKYIETFAYARSFIRNATKKEVENA